MNILNWGDFLTPIAGFLHYIYDLLAVLSYLVSQIFVLVLQLFAPVRFLFTFITNAAPTPQQFADATSTTFSFLGDVGTFFSNNSSAINLSYVWGIVYALFVAIMVFALFKEFNKI